MNAQQEYAERVERVVQLKSCLSRVIELGYGEDKCEPAILVMFEDVVRQTVPEWEYRSLSFKLPLRLPKGKNDYTHLLRLTREVHHFAEQQDGMSEEKQQGSPFAFPFLTTLGIAGGVFMLAFHVARVVS